MVDSIAAPLWEAYCSTRVRYPLTGETYELEPLQGQDSSEWPWGKAVLEVFVLSAANPFSEQLSEFENLQREQRMADELAVRGIEFLPCIGHGADGEWSESSLMLFGATAEQVRELGARFKQNAFFRWTPEAFEVVSLVSAQVSTAAWKLAKL